VEFWEVTGPSAGRQSGTGSVSLRMANSSDSGRSAMVDRTWERLKGMVMAEWLPTCPRCALEHDRDMKAPKMLRCAKSAQLKQMRTHYRQRINGSK
jgi:hypothetical protein